MFATGLLSLLTFYQLVLKDKRGVPKPMLAVEVFVNRASIKILISESQTMVYLSEYRLKITGCHVLFYCRVAGLRESQSRALNSNAEASVVNYEQRLTNHMLQKVELESTLRRLAASTCNTILLREKLVTKMVIRATMSFNLQCNNVARQVEEKCCPYYWLFTQNIKPCAQTNFS